MLALPCSSSLSLYLYLYLYLAVALALALCPPLPFNEQNSWGEYWGEMGYVRVKFGALQVEEQCAWATVKDYTAPEKENQVHCYEGGENCQ